MEGGTIQAVIVAADVLNALAAEGPMGVTQLAKRLSLPKARTHRYLKSLTKTGFVSQDRDTDKYRIGVRFWVVGQSVADQFDYLRVARREIAEIRRQLGHTVVIGHVLDTGVTALETLQGTSPLQIGTFPGTKFHFHASALGKVALAFGPPELMKRALRAERASFTARTNTDADWLIGEVEKVRRVGWAVAPEENLIGINSLAAPVFQADGSLAGAIAAVDSIQFLQPEPEERQIACVTGVAAKISAELGYIRPSTV